MNKKIKKIISLKMNKQAKKEKVDQLGIYKTIRKQMPRPGYAIEEGKDNAKRMRDFGGDGEIPNLQELTHEAEALSKIKGHMLGKWKEEKSPNGPFSINTCVICGDIVKVTDKPISGENDISGKAIDEECRKDNGQDSFSTLNVLKAKIQNAFLK